MNKANNKWMRSAIPALLIHCSIGTVYCWSLIKGDIAKHIGSTQSEIEWAFSLAIFCLGISAAFFGKIIERDVKKSSIISTICFTLGLALTGVSIYFKSLLGIYISYGVIMGIGLGIGYLSPVKTLMLWFDKQKGLATGLAITGFGLAKVIASPVMVFLLEKVGLVSMFYILAAVYFVMMITGSILIKKPEGWVEEQGKTDFKVISMFKDRTFIGIWLMIYINITCGLALISQEKDIMKFAGLSLSAVGMVSSLTAVFNAGGRLAYSAASDKLKDRNTIYKIILLLSIATVGLTIITNSIQSGIASIVIILLCAINSTYGGGFSNLPTILSDCFGMKNISKIHGLALSAWAIAGLSGNQLSAFIFSRTGSYNDILLAILALYTLALIINFTMVRQNKEVKAL
ncbi:major facilitator transporter protein [Gottschalkia acidurici 9a]|uniref:Major facilitator transporter protein n=1 Tax=Gottschalkia acidurici (strain ATCC 7906 / DSM 604 / BCRC 14475 / CIP 104303 / KCTC 5404 / NCIMB 10678 / 9a) TaxID=1128398 RepID=K0B258_GOTA9|nr:OFA family MFS transporter [Gottschalkia acidurici]AFS79005.1 major facilitator transporter protein [Gottschalkia acidurici 9a]